VPRARFPFQADLPQSFLGYLLNSEVTRAFSSEATRELHMTADSTLARIGRRLPTL
jgi:hypothetical protein